jgi:hypothetical protein
LTSCRGSSIDVDLEGVVFVNLLLRGAVEGIKLLDYVTRAVASGFLRLDLSVNELLNALRVKVAKDTLGTNDDIPTLRVYSNIDLGVLDVGCIFRLPFSYSCLFAFAQIEALRG